MQRGLLLGDMCVTESPPEFHSLVVREQARRLPAAKLSEAAAERRRRCRAFVESFSQGQRAGGGVAVVRAMRRYSGRVGLY